MVKTIEEINARILKGEAVVATAEEMVGIVRDDGVKKAAEEVDVVTTGTFGMMCSSGAFLNFGHADPPIKIGGGEVWLNDVPGYAGLAAVDTFLGATACSKSKGFEYGGGHVIEDFVSGKTIVLEAKGYGTDCYPRKSIRTEITLNDVNQAFLFNPRNAYQRYVCATNSSNRILYTYMGALLPNFGNATFSASGCLSPLYNDPDYETIGVGTKIFLGGGAGYIAGEGTQHDPKNAFGTLAVKGDLRAMNSKYLRGATMEKYGCSLYVGLGIPIPILNEGLARKTGISDEQIFTSIVDYSVQSRSRPTIGKVNYSELKSGRIELNGEEVKCASLSSLEVAREVARELKKQIEKSGFTLTLPVERLSTTRVFKPMKQVTRTISQFMQAAATCNEADDVKAVSKILVERGVNHVVVVDDARMLKGIVTSWDLGVSILKEKHKVKDVMTRKVITAKRDEPVEIAVKRMKEHNISALPVVDEKNAVIGIIGLEELSKLFSER